MDTAYTAYLLTTGNGDQYDPPPARRRPRPHRPLWSWTRSLFALAAASLLTLCLPAAAQPAGRILSGYPPGGAVDILARVVADEFSRNLGRTFIVDTKAGAGGQIAVDTLKQAQPDGGTFLVAAETNMVIYPHTVRKPTYDTPVDFIPIGQVATYDIAFASKADARVTDFASWVNLARGDADAATFASPGAGSNMHFFGVTLGDSIGKKLQHVPYRGTGPAVNDTAAGFVATVLSPVGPMLQFHDQKRLRILAISAAKRSERIPDVPTFAELGFAKLTQTGWFGLFAPAGTPPDVIAKAHAALAAGLKRAEVRARIAGMDMQIPTLDQQEFSRLVASEYASWRDTVKATGFTAEGQ
jgi:tripartite-type tricarboxylate transporter receptor subunit TctC